MEIIINGVTLEGDFMDADFVGPYEEATNKMAEKAQLNQGKKYDSFADSIIEQCTLVDEMFDNIFGEGTAEKLFKGSERNLMVHLVAVEDLTSWANGERKKLNDFTNKYTQRQTTQKQFQKYQTQKYLNAQNGGKHKH